MTPQEWDRLAWWEQKMYFDGYEWEGLIEPSEGAAEGHNPGPQDTTASATFSMVPGEMAAFGIREQTL